MFFLHCSRFFDLFFFIVLSSDFSAAADRMTGRHQRNSRSSHSIPSFSSLTASILHLLIIGCTLVTPCLLSLHSPLHPFFTAFLRSFFLAPMHHARARHYFLHSSLVGHTSHGWATLTRSTPTRFSLHSVSSSLSLPSLFSYPSNDVKDFSDKVNSHANFLRALSATPTPPIHHHSTQKNSFSPLFSIFTCMHSRSVSVESIFYFFVLILKSVQVNCMLYFTSNNLFHWMMTAYFNNSLLSACSIHDSYSFSLFFNTVQFVHMSSTLIVRLTSCSCSFERVFIEPID